LERLCQLAAEKDAGFDRRVFADALVAAAAHSDAAFAELGLERAAVAALRVAAARWRAQMLNTAGMSAVDAVGSFGTPTLGPEAFGSPSRARSAERHRPPPSNVGREARRGPVKRLAAPRGGRGGNRPLVWPHSAAAWRLR
jgi:hypothetical protein